MVADGYGLDSIEAGGHTIRITKAATGARTVRLSDCFPDAFGERYRRHEETWTCISCAEPIDRGVIDSAVFVSGRDLIVHPADADLELDDVGWMGAWPLCGKCMEGVPPDWRTAIH
jgi:hypothetical protein